MFSSKHREPTSKIMNVVFILLSSLSAIGEAIQLECGNGSDITAVEENSSNFTLTCSDYSPKAYWTRRVPGYDVQNIGSCSDSLCQPDEQLDIVMTYLSRRSSSINIRYTTRENGHSAYNCTANSVSISCQTNIFVKASLENPVVIFNVTDNWAIKGILHIKRIYSSLHRYECQWKSITSAFSENGRLVPSVLFLTPSPEDLQNKADRTGTCSFRDNVTNYSNNIYMFTVLVTPGGVPISAGTFEIARPLAPNTTCVTSNIPENSTLSCKCSTQGVGKPGGRLMWIKGRDGTLNQIINVGSYDVSTLDMEPRLTRSDDGTQFQCIVDWATNVTGILHTSNVNYGPDSVQIPENKTFYTNINGTLELRLTCQAIAAKPLSGIVYSWTGPCRGVTNASCTFRPHPPQPGNTGISNEVKCTARNPFNNNLSREDTFTIDLKYPPLQSPQITGYPQDLIIYAFDTLTLSCSINGGNPIASNTTLACFPYARNVSTGKSAIVSFNVPEGVERLECNCSGMWIVPDFYPLSSNVQFSVYYPPSAPFISRNGSAEFPYLEGDTAYLVCNISSLGYPVAELIWSGQEENYVITKRLSPIATLQLNSLTWKDNGRNITCQAKNNYTKEKGLDIRKVIVLQVYYRPIISFQHGTDNQCVLTLDQEQCIIDKDERFEIICSAHSNPSPVNFTWRLDNSSGLVVSTNANLTIANNITHNVTYICIVTTNSTYSNDTRPPLSAMKKLTFVIKEIKLAECGSEGLVQLNEAALDYNFTCTGFREVDSLTWTVHTLNGSIQAGTCFPNGTCNSLITAFPIERSSAKISRLTVKGSARAIGINAVTCMAEGPRTVSETCQIDIIFPAEANCRVQSVSGGWHIIGFCNITKVFSSLGNYTCQWFKRASEVTEWTLLSLTTYVPRSHVNVNYRQGSCSFTSDLLPEKRIYLYRVVIFPGSTSLEFGPVTIDPPQVPNIETCLPDQIVPSGRTITCICSTRYTGQPNGRLQWIFNNILLKAGNYGDTSLEMTTPILSQRDHGSQLFCSVDWIQVSHSVFHNVVVGYQPTILNLTVNGTPDSLTVTEASSGELLLLCEASARPTPATRLLLGGQQELIRQIGGNITNDRSVLKYKLYPNCESAAKYTCYAENGLGNPASSHVTLYVLCHPKWIHNPITQSYPSVNFKGAALNITFDVISYPPPNEFSFSYAGTTIIANATLTPARVDLFEIKCVLDEVLLAIVKCVLTVKNVQEQDEGYYEAVLINDLGNSKILFQVKVNASEDFESNTSNSTIIAASLTSILVVALTVLVIGLLIRRKKMLSSKGRHTGSKPAASNKKYSEDVLPISPMDTSVINSNESYDILRIQDIGISSPYEEINQYDVSSQSACGQRPSQISNPDYENRITTDQSV